MNISHLFSSSFPGYQSNSASNLRSYCWYTRRSTDLHISTSRSCSCLINPDAIYDQKQRAFWMSLGLDSNLEIALSPLVHRDYGMRFHITWRILHCVRPCLKTHLFRLAHWGVVDYDSNYDNVQRFWTFYEWKRRYINSNYYYYYYYPYLVPNNNPIPLKKETNFLGILLDSKLSCVPHMKGLMKKCIKALHLLRVVSFLNGVGMGTVVLLRLYRALVCSKLDYGCFIYGVARIIYFFAGSNSESGFEAFSRNLKNLSCTESLCWGKWALYLRREELALQFAIKIAANPNNSVYANHF